MKIRLRRSTWHIDDPRNRQLRGTLGTGNKTRAELLLARLEVAAVAGPTSPFWKELAPPVLPKKTFDRFARFFRVEPLILDHTWGELWCEFSQHAEFRVTTGNLNSRAEGRLSAKTKALYDRAADHLAEFLKAKRISQLRDITEELVELFELERRAAVAKDPRNRTGLSVDGELNRLHAILQFGVDRKKIASNPVRYRKIVVGEDNGDPFEPEEMRLLYQHAGPDLLAYSVLRWTGLRISDVVAITFEEIARRTEEINRIAIKNGKSINLPIRAELFAMIEEERARRNALPSDRVLLNPNTGKPFSINNLYRHMVALGKRARVAHVHPHRFRDTFCVDLLLKGLSLYEVGQLVGDSEGTIKRHYAKFVKAFRDKARIAIDGPGGLGDGKPETPVGAGAADRAALSQWPVDGSAVLSAVISAEIKSPEVETTPGCAEDRTAKPGGGPSTLRSSRNKRHRVAEQQQTLWPPLADEVCSPASQPLDELNKTAANG